MQFQEGHGADHQSGRYSRGNDDCQEHQDYQDANKDDLLEHDHSSEECVDSDSDRDWTWNDHSVSVGGNKCNHSGTSAPVHQTEHIEDRDIRSRLHARKATLCESNGDTRAETDVKRQCLLFLVQQVNV